MDETIKDKIRKLREKYDIAAARKAAPLFQPGADESCEAIVCPSNDVRALGFKMAADKLVDISVAEPGSADYLVYSIGYLYRMYIELRLKDIVETAKQASRNGHNLEKLWRAAKPVMEASPQWFDHQELEAVEEKIREFSQIDPSSDAWRYSTNMKGATTLKDIHAVDLRRLKQVVDSMSTALEGSYTAVVEERETGA